MSVTITYPIDEMELSNLIDEGYTSLSLWASNTPDGPYAATSVASDPATLALALSGEDYEFTWSYANGNPAQWFKVRPATGSAYSELSSAKPFHGGGGTTQAVLRQATGKLLGDLLTGTASAGSVSQLTSTNPRFTRFRDNYFEGWMVHKTSVVDEFSVCSTFTKATGIFLLSPSLADAATNGTTFELTKRWTHEEYRDAINKAIVLAYPTLSQTIVNTGLRSVLNKLSYDIPADILNLTNVEVESDTFLTDTDTSIRGMPWKQVPFVNVQDGLIKTFELRQPIMEDRRMRLTGTGLASQVYNDSDYVELVSPQTDLLQFLIAEQLWLISANAAASSDRDFYMERAQTYRQKYEAFKPSARARRAPQFLWSSDQLNANRVPVDPRRRGFIV